MWPPEPRAPGRVTGCPPRGCLLTVTRAISTRRGLLWGPARSPELLSTTIVNLPRLGDSYKGAPRAQGARAQGASCGGRGGASPSTHLPRPGGRRTLA